MSKQLNVTIERGCLIDASNLTDSQMAEVEDKLRDNEATLEELAQEYGFGYKDTAYDAQVTVEEV